MSKGKGKDLKKTFAQIPDYVTFSPNLTPNAKSIYNIIFSHTNKKADFNLWKSRDGFAAWTGLKEKAITSAIQELKQYGLIAVNRAPQINGQKYNVNEYVLLEVNDETKEALLAEKQIEKQKPRGKYAVKNKEEKDKKELDKTTQLLEYKLKKMKESGNF